MKLIIPLVAFSACLMALCSVTIAVPLDVNNAPLVRDVSVAEGTQEVIARGGQGDGYQSNQVSGRVESILVDVHAKISALSGSFHSSGGDHHGLSHDHTQHNGQVYAPPQTTIETLKQIIVTIKQHHSQLSLLIKSGTSLTITDGVQVQLSAFLQVILVVSQDCAGGGWNFGDHVSLLNELVQVTVDLLTTVKVIYPSYHVDGDCAGQAHQICGLLSPLGVSRVRVIDTDDFWYEKECVPCPFISTPTQILLQEKESLEMGIKELAGKRQEERKKNTIKQRQT
ncbi:unnamed protein product [Sympodiomycopsis kandeliae]